MCPKEIVEVSLESSPRFVLFCITCHSVLMKSNVDPFSNSVLARVAKSTSLSHSCAYHQPHQVELIDYDERTSVTLSKKQQLPFVMQKSVNLLGRTRR